MKKSISDWVRQSHITAKSKGWWDEAQSPEKEFPEKMLLVISEISEAVEEFRNGHALDEVYTAENGKPEGVPVELADALIRIFDLCGYAGIDLEAALDQKVIFNESRPYRHGGKRI